MFFGKSCVFLLDLTPGWNFYTRESVHLPRQMSIQVKGMISYIPEEKITLKVKKLAK